MIDLAITNNLDLKVEEGEYKGQENGETTTINAFFTDARIDEKRGYWLDVQQSELWKYEQARLTSESARKITETAKVVAQELVSEGLYKRIDAEAYISNGIMTLDIKCYDNLGAVVNRKFAI